MCCRILVVATRIVANKRSSTHLKPSPAPFEPLASRAPITITPVPPCPPPGPMTALPSPATTTCTRSPTPTVSTEGEPHLPHLVLLQLPSQSSHLTAQPLTALTHTPTPLLAKEGHIARAVVMAGRPATFQTPGARVGSCRGLRSDGGAMDNMRSRRRRRQRQHSQNVQPGQR